MLQPQPVLPTFAAIENLRLGKFTRYGTATLDETRGMPADRQMRGPEEKPDERLVTAPIPRRVF